MTDNGKTMVFDTPESIDRFRLVSLKHALRLKAKGFDMHRGVSLIRTAKGYGFTGRTHKQALAYVTELLISKEGKEGTQ